MWKSVLWKLLSKIPGFGLLLPITIFSLCLIFNYSLYESKRFSNLQQHFENKITRSEKNLNSSSSSVYKEVFDDIQRFRSLNKISDYSLMKDFGLTTVSQITKQTWKNLDTFEKFKNYNSGIPYQDFKKFAGNFGQCKLSKYLDKMLISNKKWTLKYKSYSPYFVLF